MMSAVLETKIHITPLLPNLLACFFTLLLIVFTYQFDDCDAFYYVNMQWRIFIIISSSHKP